jgi:protein-tyrosine phosphatase
MIDLHSHILPGLDDGAPNVETSVEMARLAAADGITHMACTPHIVPGLYDNDSSIILGALTRLRQRLAAEGIKLELCIGADIHIAPDLDEKLASGAIPTINRTRYFLFEPPHHVLPPKIEELAARLIKAGFVPIITHPERLTWIKAHYGVIESLNNLGCFIQLTADSIAGGFGRTAQYYAHKLLDEGRVDIVASDCHGTVSRRPILSEAREALAERIGEKQATAMVMDRPAAILANMDVPAVGATLPAGRQSSASNRKQPGLLGRLFSRGGVD